MGYIILIICSTVLYQLAQKCMPSGNSYFLLVVTYLTSNIIALILLLVNGNFDLAAEIKKLNAFPFILGIAIVLIDLGFILAYRNNGNMAILAPLVNGVSNSVIVLIAIIFFKEKVSIYQGLGLIFCILGVVLLSK